jgi:hypothetical protein
MKSALLACLGIMLLTACNSGGSSNSNPTGGTTTVTGRVLNRAGAPIAGAKVAIGSSLLATGADGTFTIADVAVPYDLAAFSLEKSCGTIYSGLNSSDVTVELPTTGSPGPVATPYRASVRGQLSGGTGFPQPTGHDLRFLFSAPVDNSASISTVAVGADGTYQLGVEWFGSSTLSGTVQVVQWLNDSNSYPASFDGVGFTDLTISSDQVVIGKDIRLNSVPSGRVGGTVSVATGYSLGGRSLRALVAGGDSLLLRYESNLSGSSLSSSYDYPGFSAQGLVLALTAFAQDASGAFAQGWRAGFAAGSPVDLALPAAPVIQAPETVGVGSTISWTSLADSVYDVTLKPLTAGTGPTLRIVTGAAKFQIPDLSSVGFTWPKSQSYHVDMVTFGPRKTDDVAQGHEDAPDDQDGTYTVSAQGVFMTAP